MCPANVSVSVRTYWLLGLLLDDLTFMLCCDATTTLSLAGCTFICLCVCADLKSQKTCSKRDTTSAEGSTELYLQFHFASWYFGVRVPQSAPFSLQARYKEKLLSATLERPKDSMEMAPWPRCSQSHDRLHPTLGICGVSNKGVLFLHDSPPPGLQTLLSEVRLMAEAGRKFRELGW